jgi:hypothetical protein
VRWLSKPAVVWVVFFIAITLAIRSWQGVIVAVVGASLAAFETSRDERWLRRKRAERDSEDGWA